MTTKVGLLGAGYIVDSHASALSAIPSVTLYCVADTSRGRAQRAATKYSIPHVFESVEQLAASDCEVVHLLVPPALHLETASILVEAGKSVFLEKPMGLDSASCERLCALAERKGVAVGVNHNFLFSRRYELLRSRVRSGAFGRLDHVAVDWHFAQPLLQFGPFDNWMLAKPANMLFETGPHLAAFIVDLLGLPEVLTAVADNPIEVPGKQSIFRQWNAVARAGAATAVFSISMTAGQPERILRVRGRGESAQLDFGRDIAWYAQTVTDNPIFDSYETAQEIGRSLVHQARSERFRRIKSALNKRPDANPFEDSVFRSIAAFYQGGVINVDPRHNGRFGVDVMKLCEGIAAKAGVGAPSYSGITIPLPKAPQNPDILVVGGTGFIGRRLVRRLVDRGQKVRILTRSLRAAALEFEGMEVELIAGSHGDPKCLERALSGIRAVYHLAKCEGKRWQDYVEGDIEPTRTLATMALKMGVSRFIYTGTIASYASDNPSTTIDNTTPVDPALNRRGHYARSKGTCEALLQALQRNADLGLVILRPGIVIGPGSPPAHPGVGQFTSETKVNYWGDGTNPLPLVLVDDVAEALALSLHAPVLGQTLLVSSPPLMSAREYVAALERQMSARMDAQPRAPWRYWVDDMIKELAKNSVRHPNRHWPTLHDWRCTTQRARYDASMTEQALDWHPIADRETMESRGIQAAVEWFLR